MPPSPSSSSNAGAARPATGSADRKPTKGKARARGGGQLTANEKRIWQAIYGAVNHSMTITKLERHFPDIPVEDRSLVLNSLSSKSLVSMQIYNGKLHQVVAASRSEAAIVGQLEELERMIYSHIRDCGNEGIWTKNLKSRTNIHQAQLTKTLKSLEGKELIKAVKSVKHPTRKIYMRYDLQPSIELSGGPWYTDNELDTAFINQLCNLLHRFIASRTWPKKSQKLDRADDYDRPIFFASHINELPSATSCLNWLSGVNVTPTKLEEPDINCLLDVLVYDGKIEKIPFARMEQSSSSRRRRRDEEEWTGKGRRDGYESQSDDSEIAVLSEEGSVSSDDGGRKRKRRLSKQSQGRKSGRESHSTSRMHGQRTDVGNSEVEEEDEDEDEDEEDDDGDANAMSDAITSSFVYRALRSMNMDPGWVEVPCAHCPVFEFCSPGGPVNAESCLYMREWIPRNKSTHARRSADEQSNGDGKMEVDYEDAEAAANGDPVSADDGGYASAGGASSPAHGQEDLDEDEYGGEEI